MKVRTFMFLITLFLSTFFVNAQEPKKSLAHLSGPEKWWAITHPLLVWKARKLTTIVLVTSSELKKDSALDGDDSGGQLDAFRHAYWMALLSQSFCWKKAIALGNAHEKGNYRQFKKGKKDEEFSLPDSISGVMDKFNNAVGASVGCNNRSLSLDSLSSLVQSWILNGKMLIIAKNKDGNFIGCDGEVLDLYSFRDRWYIPKCLIQSGSQIGK